MIADNKLFAERAGEIISRFAIRKNNRFLLDLWNDLVDGTPVDTGAARSNWYITPGRRAYRNNPKTGQKYPRPPEPDVYHYTYRWKNWYITNTSPYIAILNEGTSSRPKYYNGWVDDAIVKNLLKHGGKLTRSR